MKTTLLPAVLLGLAAAPAALRAQSPAPTPAGYVDAFKPSSAQPLAERQARTAQRLSTRLTSGERQLLLHFTALYTEVWRNPDGLTPQQVCDALGNRAGNLFVIAGTMAGALYGIDPAGIGPMINVPSGYTVAINADGTVTLTYAAPAPTPANP